MLKDGEYWRQGANSGWKALVFTVYVNISALAQPTNPNLVSNAVANG